MNVHRLKIRPEFAKAIAVGDKTFEIRDNSDRGFQKGDLVSFVCYDGTSYCDDDNPIKGRKFFITYVLGGWGLKDNWVVFSFKPVENP